MLPFKDSGEVELSNKTIIDYLGFCIVLLCSMYMSNFNIIEQFGKVGCC